MKRILVLLLVLVCGYTFAQPNSWETRGVGGGGSLFAPSISPHDPSVVYIQCDMTEVFHTVNFGQSWQEVDFRNLVSTGGQHSVEFTSDPNILYTVNSDFLSGDWFPVKSIDAGQSWAPVDDPTFGGTWFISADPNDTDRILISSYSELFFSSDGGNSFASVYDAGGDFHIAGVFWDGSDIYVGTQVGLVASTDNGASFNLDGTAGIPSGEGFISFTGAKENGLVRLAGTTALMGDLYPGVRAWDIYIYSSLITRDVGVTNWQTSTNGIDPNHDLFHTASSLIDNSVFYAGGLNSQTSFPVVYKTSDGGLNWNEVLLTNNNQNIATGWCGFNGDRNWWYGEIVFGLGVAPNDPDRIIFTDFGFAHVSADGGSNWNQAYVNSQDENPATAPTPTGQSYAGNGLENTSAWQLTWIDQDNIFASYTDITGIRSADGGQKWSFNYTGANYNTIYDIVRHPTSGTLFAAVSSVHDIYQSTYLGDAQIDGGDGAILYSTDDGLNWNMLEDFGMNVIWLALDPNDSDKMYASVVNSANGGVYATSDLNNLTSASWSLTTAPPRTEGHPYNIEVLNDGTLVSTWCARRNPGFTNSSGVFISQDDGVTWIDVSMDDEMHYWTKDICIDPNDLTQNTWYVAVHSGWGGAANNKGGLYKTTDRGQSWTSVFASHRVESATVHPSDPNIVYASTESEGLWYCSNATSTTPLFDQVSSYTFQHPMRIVYNPYDVNEVWVTSFGNGLKVSSDNSVGTDEFAAGNPEGIMVYPNPTSGTFSLNTNVDFARIEIIDLTGRKVFESSNVNRTFDISHLNSGGYCLRAWDTAGKSFSTQLFLK